MKKRDLTQGDIWQHLIVLAVPTMISMLFLFIYGFTDLLFLSTVGDWAISGVGSATLIQNLTIAFNFVAVTGAGIKIAHSIGQNNQKNFDEYYKAGMFINITFAIISFIFLFFFGNTALGKLGLNEKETFEAASTYLKYMAFSSLFSFTNLYFTRVFNSLGKNINSTAINCIGIVLNIVLDALFVIVLKHGVAGAALATLISNIVITTTFLCVYFDTLKIKKAVPIKSDKMKEIFRIGFPYTAQRLFFTYIGLQTGKYLIAFGDEAMGAQKIGFQIESITLMLIGGLLTAVTAFTGQNFGKGSYERIKEGYSKALILGVLYASFTSIIFLMFGKQIVSLFFDSPLAITYATMYLKTIAIGQVFAVFEMVSNGLYSGLGLTIIPTTISISLTALRIPLFWVLIPRMGISGIYTSIVITSILKGIVSYGIYLFSVKDQIGVKYVSDKK